MIPRYLVNFDINDLDSISSDFLVIGSGIAGLFSALKLSSYGKVHLLTKEKAEDCNTEYAQGGIAAAIGKKDTASSHFEDTVEAGAGLCNPHAVDILVSKGRESIKELIDLGVAFDKKGNQISLTQEGAHSYRRILHAGGDATGTEIRNTLIEQVYDDQKINISTETFVIDLIKSDGRCCGVIAKKKNGSENIFYSARAVILATGGAGQLYTETSNPSVATGDGIALAYRAGVEVMDLEFIQFHPTTLRVTGRKNFLISEAIRGEGGVLRNQHGDRFMPDYHHRAELASRDIVTRAIFEQIKDSGSSHVYLDVTGLDAEFVKSRFPTIYRTCLEEGIDITREYIPVFPAAHYLMGGIKVNTYGETALDGLYACGETACCGLHGANRLASNSLLDGLVFSSRVVEKAVKYINNKGKNLIEPDISSFKQDSFSFSEVDLRERLHKIMTKNAGILRSGDGLKQSMEEIKSLFKYLKTDSRGSAGYEAQNLMILSYLVTKAALIREESRGAHYREDFPETNDEWLKHIVFQRNKDWRDIDIDFS